jgi:peptidoglycan/LPS O-acetylase OafA/YrhL
MQEHGLAASSAAPSKGWNRVDGVDLIRGVAILFVLMNHVNMQLLFAHVPWRKGLPPQLISSLVWNGQYGVQMFFAVSGFLITATSLRRWGSLGAVRPRAFYILRFARIAPLLLLLLAILSALDCAQVAPFLIKSRVASLGAALLYALTFRINVLEAFHGYLPGNWDILWSLSVEEMFYLFFPFACVLLRRRSLFLAVLAGFIAAGPFARTVLTHGNEVWREYSYLGSTDAIALGCLTAVLLHATNLGARTRWLLGVLLGVTGSVCVGAVLLASIALETLGLERLGLDMTVLATGTCMLIAVAAETQWTAPRVLAPILWLGRRSYEIYLTHMFVVIALFAIYLRLGKPLAAVPLLFAGTIVAAAALGGIVAQGYAEPMNHWIRQRLHAENPAR